MNQEDRHREEDHDIKSNDIPFADLISHLSRKLRQVEFERQSTSGYLSPGKLNLLQQIKKLNPITLKELSKIEKVALPTLSKLVDELQKQALVIRAQAKNDARKKWIVPTQKGIRILETNKKDNQLYWQNKLKSLNKSEHQTLNSSLLKLLKNL
ncbi:MAG: MarR family winged helix-turn-helix transcriptional regulator [Kangiellaceae bacterium]